MDYITRQAAEDFIYCSGGRIFSAEFVKRTTGETRLINCRLGVKSHLKGAEPAYDAPAKGLICVFDMQKQAYRSIAVEGLTRICVGGQWKEVTG